MKALKIDATIDAAVVKAIPALAPLLGRHVELIALDAESHNEAHRLTPDELLARRIKLPPGTDPLTQDDIDRAIAEGALGR
jgi:hypothetical protein